MSKALQGAQACLLACLFVSLMLTYSSFFMKRTPKCEQRMADPKAVREQGAYLDLGRTGSRYFTERPREVAGLEIFPPSSNVEVHIDIMDRPTEAAAKYNKSAIETHAKCSNTSRVGNQGDGGWDICLAGPYAPGPGCLVYSFGIQQDWSFDDDIAQRFKCKVKSFDPSLQQYKSPFNRSENVAFYPYGLGGYDRINKQKWPMKTLTTIITEIGDAGKTIDYLKFDIERSEWESLETMLADGVLSNVKQVAMETHTRLSGLVSDITKLEYHYYTQILRGLYIQGFRRWQSSPNTLCLNERFAEKEDRPLYDCHNMVYINKHFLS